MTSKLLSRIISTYTFKHAFLTVGATAFSGVLGILFYLLGAKFLSTQNYALLVISISFITISSDCLDFGLNSSLLRFIPSFPEEAFAYIKTIFLIKFFAWISFMIVGFICAPIIATNLLNQPMLILPLRLSLLGVGTATFFAFSSTVLQSFQKIKAWCVILITSNFLRLLFVIAILLFSALDLYSSLWAYILFPVVGFLITFFLISVRDIREVRIKSTQIKDLLNYSKWIGLTTIVMSLGIRLDTFINTHFLSLSQVGSYALSSQITLFFLQFAGALGVVISVRFSRFKSKTLMVKFLLKVEALLVGAMLLGLLLLPILKYFILVIIGNKFAGSLGIFNLLFISSFIFFLSIPFQDGIRYFFKNSKYLFLIYLFQLLTQILLGVYLVTSFGAIGTAWSVLISNLINLILSSSVFFILLKKSRVLEMQHS